MVINVSKPEIKKDFTFVHKGNGTFSFPDYCVDPSLLKDIRLFFDSIAHLTVDDSHTKEGLRQIIVSFRNFLENQQCYNALYNFEILLKEKGADDAFRANGVTPNILHEIRNIAHTLGQISTGYIPMNVYAQFGGLDADISGRLRHDSIEDKAKRQKEDILIGMEANLDNLTHDKKISSEQHHKSTYRAVVSAKIIDLMSRKDVKFDPETGLPIKKENGKFVKIERYNGDENEYFKQLLKHPLALLCKYADRIENISTRYGVSRFTLAKNKEYAEKTRRIYGIQQFIAQAIKKWSVFSYAIKANDAMLGIQLRIFEGVNNYMGDAKLNTDTAHPFVFDEYITHGLHAYHTLPQVFHPLTIAIHSLENHPEQNERIQSIVQKLIIPPLRQAVQHYGFNPIEGISNTIAIFKSRRPPSSPASPN